MTVIATKRQQLLAGLLLTWILFCGPPARAGILWYNGDLDNRDAFSNQTSSSSGGIDGRIYENFIVPAGTTWTITSVFSNDVLNPLFSPPNTTTASWEIRSGVSAGNGGTLLASGDGADVITPTGRTSSVFAPFPASEYTNQVNGLSVTLGAGTYWLSVAPDTDGLVNSYWNVSTTSGANAIGNPAGNDGNSFFSSTFTGDFFTPTASLEGPGNWDYSLGVIGTAQASTVPEPSGAALALGASLILAGYAYRRRKPATLASRA
ncbi:MAG TPA: hypothetical protein VK395_12125 [Gemmataceae bacterium]|nr:hypothetical protein [Gemmataceae bacterium]